MIHFSRGSILIYLAPDIRNGRLNQAKCRCYLGSGEWTTTNLDKLKPAALKKNKKKVTIDLIFLFLYQHSVIIMQRSTQRCNRYFDSSKGAEIIRMVVV